MVESQASPENREGECSFIKERGSWSCYRLTNKQKSPLEETVNSKCTGFSLAGCYSVSLAGLLQGEEKIFFLCWVVE